MTMKSVVIDRFSGGLNTRDAAARLKRDMFSDANNVIIDETSVGSRLGQSAVGDALPAAPHSEFDYVNVNAGTRKTITAAGVKLYADGVEIATGLSGNPLSFAVLNSVLYIADGVNKIKSFNGSIVATLAASPNALAIAAHRGCLIAIGQVGAKNLLQWSDTNDPGTWPSDRTASIQDGDPGGLVAVGEYFHQLAVFKRKVIYLMDGFPAPTGWFRLPTDKGCVSRDSLQTIDQGLIWRGEMGVYRLMNGEVSPASSLLDPTFETLNPVRLANSFGIVHKGKYYLSVASAGSSVEDLVLVLNLLSGGWTVWRGVTTTCLGILPTGAGDYALFAGQTDGKIVRLNYGGDDQGGAYSSFVRLAPIVFRQEVTLAQLDLVLSDLGDTQVTVSYSLDNGRYVSKPIAVQTSGAGAVFDVSTFDESVFGEASTSLHQKRAGGTCRQIEITIGSQGPRQPWMLHRLELFYVPGGW